MKRHWVSTFIAMLFITLAVTGVMGFFLPFNLLTVSVHALVGFVFIASIALHIKNNYKALKYYFTKRSAAILLLFVVALVTVILLQPRPVTAIIGLSSNVGPDPSRFELDGQRMLYRYDPSPQYRMLLEVMGGSAYDVDDPPFVAIWIENRSGYHIKSLYHSEQEGYESQLPYWHYKRSEYLRYKAEHEAKSDAERQAEADELDAVSSATENDSFDPADYIVPRDPGRESPYRVMIEINQPGDGNQYHADQPGLVYAVEVDNSDSRTFQVLEIVGYPVAEKDEDGETAWSLYFADETITTALDLLDSALLRIARPGRSTGDASDGAER
ncbi:MAG: hypothetical protein AAF085_08975 [Planctomycetota bacterium]